MHRASLNKITKALKVVFKALESHGLHDNAIRHRYAEFYVASELAKRGHVVQLLGDREDKNADLYLPKSKARVEVKSSKYDSDDWAYASFGNGNQIEKKRFDYCVFVTFDCDRERIRDVFVFTCAELKPVAGKRKRVAHHEATNPCGLLQAPSRKDFQDYVRTEKVKIWDIEEKLSRNPAKYRRAWGRIK